MKITRNKGFTLIELLARSKRHFYEARELANHLCVPVAWLMFFIVTCPAAPGDIDFSFDAGSGIDGRVAEALVQPDGKILIRGGFTTVRGLIRDRLVRLNADGTGDQTFKPALRMTDSSVVSFLLQPDGKVIVCEQPPDWRKEVVIKRLNPDGSTDFRFDFRGTNRTVTSAYRVLRLDSQGRVLVAARSSYDQMSKVARLISDGLIDTTFTNVSLNGEIHSAQIQSDGQIVVGGTFAITGPRGRTNIVRLTASGQMDETFKAVLPSGQVLAPVLVQADGKMYVAVSGSSSASVHRLLSDGSMDPTFQPQATFSQIEAMALDSAGKLLVPADGGIVRLNADGSVAELISVSGSLSSVIVQGDAKLFFAGDFTEVAGVRRVALARLKPDDTVDSAFDANPVINGISVVAMQSDHEILVGGSFTHVGEVARAGIARLQPDGKLDGAFDAKLRRIFNGIEDPARVDRITVLKDRKLAITGYFTQVGEADRFNAALLNPDGSPDPTSPLGGEEQPTVIAAQDDGRLLIGGGYTGNTARNFISRLNVDGTIDQTYASPEIGSVENITIQPDGKAIVAGNTIARLNTDGSINDSFTVFTVPCGRLSTIGLQSSGKIIVGARLACPQMDQLFRLNADGVPDPLFAKWTNDEINGVSATLIDPNDRIVLAFGGMISDRLRLTRLNADGTLDQSFAIVANAADQHLGTVTSIARQADGKFVVGGNFVRLQGVPRWNLARLEGDPLLLAIRRLESGTLSLEWPSSWTGFEVEESPDILGNWQPVNTVPTIVGANHAVEVSATDSARFFRLRRVN